MVSLYLMDTDHDKNSVYDRNITKNLYGGDWENRLKQEYLLGIGGVLMLKKLGIKKDIYHCNEGHAALCNVERLVEYVSEGMSFNEALELVRASSLYTVHTPVLSQIHCVVPQNNFNGILKVYFPDESQGGYVTNGVHYPTWAANEWKTLYNKHFDKNFLADQSNEHIWKAIYNVPDDEIWNLRVSMKTKLLENIPARFRENCLKQQGTPTRNKSLLPERPVRKR